MRAIDADALIDDLKHDVAMDQDSLDYEELTDSNRENIQFDKDCKQNAIDLLQHAPTIEPEIVRCKDCKNWGDDDCPMRFIEQVEYDDDGYIEHDDIIHDYTKDDGFCDRAERRTDGSD